MNEPLLCGYDVTRCSKQLWEQSRVVGFICLSLFNRKITSYHFMNLNRTLKSGIWLVFDMPAGTYVMPAVKQQTMSKTSTFCSSCPRATQPYIPSLDNDTVWSTDNAPPLSCYSFFFFQNHKPKDKESLCTRFSFPSLFLCTDQGVLHLRRWTA